MNSGIWDYGHVYCSKYHESMTDIEIGTIIDSFRKPKGLNFLCDEAINKGTGTGDSYYCRLPGTGAGIVTVQPSTTGLREVATIVVSRA